MRILCAVWKIFLTKILKVVLSARVPDRQLNFEFYEIIKEYNLHKCAVATNGCKKEATDKCKRGYDSFEITEETYIDSRGFPVYKRLTEHDLKVVPYCPDMSLDWVGHIYVVTIQEINVASCICSTIYSKANQNNQ